MKNIAVIGSTGAIGCAMVGKLQQKYPSARLHLLSKAGLDNAEPMVFAHRIDIIDEESIKAAASRIDEPLDRKSTRLNSSHDQISYAVFCLKKKKYLQ